MARFPRRWQQWLGLKSRLHLNRYPMRHALAGRYTATQVAVRCSAICCARFGHYRQLATPRTISSRMTQALLPVGHLHQKVQVRCLCAFIRCMHGVTNRRTAYRTVRSWVWCPSVSPSMIRRYPTSNPVGQNSGLSAGPSDTQPDPESGVAFDFCGSMALWKVSAGPIQSFAVRRRKGYIYTNTCVNCWR